MAQVGIREARTRLSQLVREVEAGGEVVITRRGKPVAKLVAIEPARGPEAIRGSLKGQLWMADDFDELPDDIAEAFGAR